MSSISPLFMWHHWGMTQLKPERTGRLQSGSIKASTRWRCFNTVELQQCGGDILTRLKEAQSCSRGSFFSSSVRSSHPPNPPLPHIRVWVPWCDNRDHMWLELLTSDLCLVLPSQTAQGQQLSLPVYLCLPVYVRVCGCICAHTVCTYKRLNVNINLVLCCLFRLQGCPTVDTLVV